MSDYVCEIAINGGEKRHVVGNADNRTRAMRIMSEYVATMQKHGIKTAAWVCVVRRYEQLGGE